MEVYRPSTRDSQRTFVPALQPVEFPKDLRLSHTLSTTNSLASTPYYSDEKSVVESPILGHAALPALRPNSPLPNSPLPTSPRQGSHWTERDLDPLPRYPGTPVDVPGTLEVPPIEQQSRFEGTICGVRRRLFILLLGGGAIVLLAIAIGVGVGVGLSHQKQIGAEVAVTSVPPPHESAAPATTIPVPAVTKPTSTSVVSSPTATGSCPGMDNRQFLSSNGKMFLHLCGVDYAGANEANDIGNATTATFKECMELCSKKTGCTGVGWGLETENEQDGSTCWMKNSLNQSHTAVPRWNFAVVLASDR